MRRITTTTNAPTSRTPEPAAVNPEPAKRGRRAAAAKVTPIEDAPRKGKSIEMIYKGITSHVSSARNYVCVKGSDKNDPSIYLRVKELAEVIGFLPDTFDIRVSITPAKGCDNVENPVAVVPSEYAGQFDGKKAEYSEIYNGTFQDFLDKCANPEPAKEEAPRRPGRRPGRKDDVAIAAQSAPVTPEKEPASQYVTQADLAAMTDRMIALIEGIAGKRR